MISASAKENRVSNMPDGPREKPHNDADSEALGQLMQTASAGRWDQPAPVEEWNPDNCGDIGLEIRRDGSWWYQGSPIGRERIRRLFSRILRKDADGETYLVTPHEKIRITVEAAPFMAVRVERAGRDIMVTTNFDEQVIIDENHSVRVELSDRGPLVFVCIRGRLEALLTRSAFYDLVELAERNAGSPRSLVVCSAGTQYLLGMLEDEAP
jgi:uncharacterized protein